MAELFGDEAKAMDLSLIVKFASTCSKWGERVWAKEHPGYEPDPLTEDDMFLMMPDEINAIFSETVNAINRDNERTVEIAQEKNPKKEETMSR